MRSDTSQPCSRAVIGMTIRPWSSSLRTEPLYGKEGGEGGGKREREVVGGVGGTHAFRWLARCPCSSHRRAGPGQTGWCRQTQAPPPQHASARKAPSHQMVSHAPPPPAGCLRAREYQRDQYIV